MYKVHRNVAPATGLLVHAEVPAFLVAASCVLTVSHPFLSPVQSVHARTHTRARLVYSCHVRLQFWGTVVCIYIQVYTLSMQFAPQVKVLLVLRSDELSSYIIYSYLVLFCTR